MTVNIISNKLYSKIRNSVRNYSTIRNSEIAAPSTIFETYRYNRWYLDILQYQVALNKSTQESNIALIHSAQTHSIKNKVAGIISAQANALANTQAKQPTLIINVGAKNAASDITELLRAYVYLTILANNCESKVKLTATKALKSIASWKLRKGTPIGVRMEITDIGDILKILDSLQIEKGASILSKIRVANPNQSISAIELFLNFIPKTKLSHNKAQANAQAQARPSFGFSDLFIFKYLHPYDFLRTTSRDIKIGFNVSGSIS